MKKTLAFSYAVAAVACLAATDVGAQTSRPAQATAAAQQVAVSQVLATKVKGDITINVTNALPNELAGFACSNISVTATSKDTYPPPPGGLFSTPKWTRTAAATGTFSTKKCSYSLVVPAKSDFYLMLSGAGNFACHVVTVRAGQTGAAIGPLRVALGGTKTQNFEVTWISCDFIN